MSWFGVSSNFPEMMGINIIEGRNFRESDQYENNPRAVCLINTTAAKEIRSWFSPEEVPDMAALVGKYIYDNSTPEKSLASWKTCTTSRSIKASVH